MAGEVGLNMDPQGPQVLPVTDPVVRATDPAISNVATPADFAAQFPTPLDPLEILDKCEDVSVWQAIPEHKTGLKTELWREMTSLAFTSGSNYIAFTDGACPEEYEHDGENLSVDLKNIGAKKSLTISDIMHSAAVVSGGAGIEALLGAFPGSANMPGGANQGTFGRQAIADLKEKEVRLAMTLVMNGWDNLLVNGDTDTSALQFNGIVDRVTSANGAHCSVAGASGSFSAASFDRFLTEGCAKPTHIFGHTAAIAEMMAGYFALGFNGSQNITFPSGNRITPGYNFSGYVNTGVGQLAVVADIRFPRVAAGSNTFQSTLYPLRMVHNGEDLVYKITQIPLALTDLAPGCTAISFEVWAKTALVIKAMCAQSCYTALFTGQMVTTCPVIG